MMDNRQKARFEYLEQLGLGLDVPEEESSGISPDEALRRSETARLALERLISPKHALTPPGEAGEGSDGAAQRSETTGFAWLDEYWKLRDAGWHWRVAAYIAWAASPKVGRTPRTQEELAQQILGLTSDRVIATWRKKNPVIDDVISLMQAAPLLSHRRDFYDALAWSASQRDHRSKPDRQLAFELLGDYVPRARLDLRKTDDVADLSTYSDEELDALARQVLMRGNTTPDTSPQPASPSSSSTPCQEGDCEEIEGE